MNLKQDLVRLSSWVYFVSDKYSTVLHHALNGTQAKLNDAQMQRISSHYRFVTMTEEMANLRKLGMLVAPGEDPLSAAEHDAQPHCEKAALLRLWDKLYWKEEIESNRDYRWRDKPICKMPEDLMFYQELITEQRMSYVLELGCQPGGSAQFFVDMLRLNRDYSRYSQRYLGIDKKQYREREAVWSGSGPGIGFNVQADAHSAAAFDAVNARNPLDPLEKQEIDRWDLVVIDADETVDGRLALLESYAKFVAPDGIIVVEDVSRPDFVARGREVSARLDQFLLSHEKFEIVPAGRRFLGGKATRAAFRRRY